MKSNFTHMKLIISVTLSLLSFVAFPQNAGEYMQRINSNWEPIAQETWDYLKATARGNAKKQDKRRLDLIEAIKKASYNTSQIGSFQGNSDFVKAVNSYLGLTLASLQGEYQKIIDLEELAQKSYDMMELYIATKELVNHKMDSANEVLQAAQREFAKNNSITLIESESRLERKINTANLALNYYNDIYLIFFKSYLQEVNFLEAQKKQSIGDMEQSRQSLEDFSKAGMEQLTALPDYQTDSRLKSACFAMLEFYYGEAKRYAPQLIEFYLANDEFTETKARMESKKNPTQAEVTEYNKAVNSINMKSQEFNKTNSYLNEHRGKRMNVFNHEVENFFQAYMK